ncbi:hypothetical protein AALP_AA5G022000 [Arabis alpina]|uniref:Uncharacterized protein n=1 Tax=Arabis alpina TaxID=50452 RepID=A0A087GUF7_ARAAL|nr:hypothetical protein AALP_AA5G022000 [Arabis alpina]
MASSPSPTVNLGVVLSESKRIINAHSRHFLALSVLFLLPNSFCITVFPSVLRLITDQSTTSHNTVSLLRSSTDPNAKTLLLLLIAYVIIITVCNLLAIGSIVYSIYQGFYGRPVKLISAVKSSVSSFIPLFATLISTNSIYLGVFLILGFVAFLVTKLIEIVTPGLEIGLSSPLTIVTLISCVFVLKFQIDWILSWTIVVVESVWGLASLKRSKSLTKGMRSESLSIVFWFSLAQTILVWISNAAASAQFDNGEKLWTNAFFAVQIVITASFLTLAMLYNLAATTVMYMHCKAIKGELALEIAEEFAREYVSLPFDDGKVPHLVSVAYNNV